MAKGRTDRPSGRLAVGACLVFVCVVVGAVGIAIAAPGDYVKSFGPDGTSATQFSKPAALGVDQATGAVYVGDSQTQTLYKFDGAGNALNWGGVAANISGNKVTGLSLNTGEPGTAQVAIDPETHVVYVTSANKVRAFEANGEQHKFTAGPGSGTNQIPGATKLYGLAVDASGIIYASDPSAKKVRIYSRSGALITEFSPLGEQLSALSPANLAVAPDGTLYLVDLENSGQRIYALEPSKFPVTSKTSYSHGQPLEPSVPSRSVAVDPTTEYVYGGGGSQVSVYNEIGGFRGSIKPEGAGELKGGLPGIGVNGAGQKLYVVLRAASGGLSQVNVFETFPIPVEQPTIFGPAVTDITSSSAVLRARINPNTLETTYWFQYGLVNCVAEPDACIKVPAGGASAGSGHNPVPVSAALSGLSPGSKYFFRLIAENSLDVSESPLDGSKWFFTSIGQFGSQLSDNRVWEQVTPSSKFGGVVTNSGLVQADPDGTGITFQTRGSLVENPDGNRALETSQVLARRSVSAWEISDLVPPHTEAGGLGFGPEFKLFSHDLGKALLEPRDDTSLSPEASERTPYLRTNTSPPSYRPLITAKEGFENVPADTVFGGEVNGGRNPVSIDGANSSLTNIVVSAEAPLVVGAQKRSIYQWNDGALEPVSELPEDEAVTPGEVVTAQLGSGTISVRHAVSEDGTRVFWAPGDVFDASLDWPALYLRDTVADRTTRIDEPEAGASEDGARRPAFMAANADGSVVFFTDSQQLTEDASQDGRDLYRCAVGNVGGDVLGCTDIEDLSAPLEGSGENGEAQELSLGMSEDGSSLYFVANAVLNSQPNEAGETATPGGPNLYLWREGQETRFVALLSEEDQSNWGDRPTSPVGHGAWAGASSSPSGRYLVFMSQRNLTESESDEPSTGAPVEQAFLYDAVEDDLVCVSCNFSGATDLGHKIAKDESEGGVIFPDPQQLWSGRLVGATLPESSEGEPTVGFALYWPRAVLDNGRAFFNSASPLVSGDSNGNWDVYQYEPLGLGTCSQAAGSGMIAVGEKGCVSLISSGLDELPSVFMDASNSGDDVFFATFARLAAFDTDDIVDVYDARVGGMEAVVEQHQECAGEACQPSSPPPGDSTPNSATFNGSGNVEQKRNPHCRKGQRKVKRNGRTKCVKAKKKHKHRKHGKSSQSKGRA